MLIEDWPSKALNIAEMMLPAGLTERALGLPFVEQSHLVVTSGVWFPQIRLTIQNYSRRRATSS